MLRDIQRVLENGVALTIHEANRLHAMLMGIILASLAIIMVMWGINSLGWKQVNIIFFLLGGLYILLQITKPATVAVAAGAGVVVAAFADKDKSQGALAGLYALYKIAVGALFGFWVLAGLLATWSFQEKPGSFFYIMAMVLTIAVTVEVFGLKGGKMPAKVIITYAVVVILAAFWQTITEEQKTLPAVLPKVELGGFAIGSSNSSNGPMVASYVFRGLGDGPVKKEVDRTGRMEIHFRAPSDVTWYVCGRVVAPTIVRSHSDKPGVEMKIIPSPPGWHYYEFTEEFVNFLKENDVRAPLVVEFTLKEATNGLVPATCPR